MVCLNGKSQRISAICKVVGGGNLRLSKAIFSVNSASCCFSADNPARIGHLLVVAKE